MAVFNISKTKRQTLKYLIFLALSQACASKNNFAFDQIYKKEMEFQVDQVKATGVFVAPKKPGYSLKFELPDKPSVIKFTTCHREETFRDVVGKSIELEFSPIQGLEDAGSCLLEVAAFDQEGAHSWALIDFEDSERLQTLMNCNGKMTVARGVSLCQSKAGLIQKLTFPLEVKAYTNDECSPMESKDGKIFTYVMGQDKCIYLFSDGKNEHRHTTFGYDEVLIK